MVCAQAVTTPLTEKSRHSLTLRANQYLLSQKVKAFYALGENSSLSQVAKAMLQTLGIGKLRPNIVLLGFKSDWQSCPISDLCDYFMLIQ